MSIVAYIGILIALCSILQLENAAISVVGIALVISMTLHESG